MTAKLLVLFVVPILFVIGAMISPDRVSTPPPKIESIPQTSIHEPIKPIPTELHLDQRKVELGERLFNDPRLARDGATACASCHDLNNGGGDSGMHANTASKMGGALNTPTVFNCGFNFRQFWDGRAATLEEQVDGPLLNPTEMASTWSETLAKLRADPAYVTEFRALFGGEIQPAQVRSAIAEFERSLITPNSRFDQYLRGKQDAITAEEKEGYRKFKAYGCASCHQGVNVGGNMFEQLGAVADYYSERKATSADLGRFNVTHNEEDRHVFKVPGLRNVALTAPYFHDGSAETLEEAIEVMGQYQLGRKLSQEDIEEISSFLETLTGEYRGAPL